MATVSTVPIIYAHHRPLPKLSFGHRAIAAVVSALCLTVLTIAARLHPDPHGMGTHLQLELQPCGLLTTTGLPCPTCGMTTSFAFLAHGQILASFAAQPAGTVFAFVAAMAVWIGLYIAVTGRPSGRLFNQMPIHRVFLVMLAVGLAGWMYKMAAVWHAARS